MNDSYESDTQSAADYASSSEANDYSDYAGYGSESDTSQRQVSALKVPPHSIEAEQAVLGGLMLDNTEWDNLADVLMPEDFYRAEHQLIFDSERGEQTDRRGDAARSAKLP